MCYIYVRLCILMIFLIVLSLRSHLSSLSLFIFIFCFSLSPASDRTSSNINKYVLCNDEINLFTINLYILTIASLYILHLMLRKCNFIRSLTLSFSFSCRYHLFFMHHFIMIVELYLESCNITDTCRQSIRDLLQRRYPVQVGFQIHLHFGDFPKLYTFTCLLRYLAIR
jgi:hypothetical protein